MPTEPCAILFPGQGAQFVGMGKDLAEAFPAAAEVFRRANEVVGFDLAALCFEGPEEALTSTANSQPAIYTVSFAVLEALKAENRLAAWDVKAAAGLSLGELTALAFAGAMTFEEGLRLVRERGRCMQAAAEANPGGMAAVIGLDEAAVTAVCEEAASAGVVAPANINSPEQIVVSGAVEAVEAASRLALERGARSVVPLRVSAAFHSPLMRPARERFAEALDGVTFGRPAVPVISNVTAEPHGDGAAIRAALLDQIDHPVRWWPSMQRFLDDGVREFREVGPGRVLAGMLKRIDRTATCTSIGTRAAVCG